MNRKLIRFVATFAILLLLPMTIGSKSSAAVKAPRMNLKILNLTKGDDFTLRIYNLSEEDSVSFKSTDTDVVTIDKVAPNTRSVTIIGKAVGKATIKAIVKRNKQTVATLKCKVKVTPVPVSIKFTENTVTMKEGTYGYINAGLLALIIKPYNATEEPVYESSNEEVCTVNARGRVEANSPGKAKITATLLSTGIKATFTVIVKENTEDD